MLSTHFYIPKLLTLRWVFIFYPFNMILKGRKPGDLLPALVLITFDYWQ